MLLQERQFDLGEVGDWCEKWTNVVRLFAEKRSARESIRDEDYRALHAKLLEACQAAASQAGLPSEQEATVLELQSLAQPWMNLESLQKASPQIALDLLHQGETCQERLGKAKPARRSSVLLVFLLIFGIGFLVTLGFGLAYDTSLSGPLADQLFGFIASIRKGIQFLHAQSLFWPMGTAIFALLVGLAYIVFRAPRNY